MNRRGFLTQLFKGTAGLIIAPQIITHGLNLRNPIALELIEPDWINMHIPLYEALPFYLAEIQVGRMDTYKAFSALSKNRRWKSHMGSSILTPV